MATHNVTQSLTNTNLSDGLAAKKEQHHEANEGANLQDKNKRQSLYFTAKKIVWQGIVSFY
jgi:hypothetical protein